MRAFARLLNDQLWPLAIIHHAAGRPLDGDAALHELIAKHGEEDAAQVAEVYAARGDTELTFQWLDRAYMQRDGELTEMKTRPYFRSRNPDTRWGAFLREMGLAD